MTSVGERPVDHGALERIRPSNFGQPRIVIRSLKGEMLLLQAWRLVSRLSTAPSPYPLSIDDVENIAIRILEPGDFHVAANVNISLSGHARHIVMLERDALGF